MTSSHLGQFLPSAPSHSVLFMRLPISSMISSLLTETRQNRGPAWQSSRSGLHRRKQTSSQELPHSSMPSWPSALQSKLSSTLGTLSLCHPSSKDPSHPETNDYHSFFSSDFCLMEHFDLFQMQTLCVTSGYLAFDIYICWARM
jgi:hypothetical protein